MKAISLWQPWASAIAMKLKRFETRGWKCPDSLIGQPLAIHAAMKKDWACRLRWVQHRCSLDPHSKPPEDLAEEQRREIAAAIKEYDALPRGAILCLVRVNRCWKVEELLQTPDEMQFGELDWGNYDEGRFAWELSVIYTFDKPIQCLGKQGLFNWSIPDEWMQQAAEEAGMPEMMEIWKAVKP